jgi:triosephosphate isomerase
MSNREIHIVGNWKMNQSLEEIKNFFVEFSKIKMDLKCKAWIAPQFIHLPILKELAFTTGNIQVGAQNCSECDSGAYTGEVSAKSLADIGAEFVIIGHSERRTIFKEDNALLNKKLLNALANNLKVIFCVGETLDEREAGKTFAVVEKQLAEGLKLFPNDKASLLLIAYEPVWAIGTGKTASKEEAEVVHAFIRGKLPPELQQTVILYGGSVKPDNIDSLLRMPNIDGALVGGASLKATDFKALCVAGSSPSSSSFTR